MFGNSNFGNRGNGGGKPFDFGDKDISIRIKPGQQGNGKPPINPMGMGQGGKAGGGMPNQPTPIQSMPQQVGGPMGSKSGG